jgi:hypothetical protein
MRGVLPSMCKISLPLYFMTQNFTRDITLQGKDKLVDLVNVGVKTKHL